MCLFPLALNKGLDLSPHPSPCSLLTLPKIHDLDQGSFIEQKQ